jgi:parallel beta-helix repeat protein
MSGSLIPNAKQQYLDANGNPLAGGFVYYYIPGTTTFKNTYQNAALTILNSNPIILDSAGECIAYGNGSYRQIVTDVNGNLIWDQPTISLSTNDASNVIYTPPFTNSVAETVTAKLSEILSVKDFGAKGDGTTDDSLAFTTACSVSNRNIYVPPGTYYLASQLVISTSNIKLYGPGTLLGNNVGISNDAMIKVTGSYVTIKDITINQNNITSGRSIYVFGAAYCTIDGVTSYNCQNAFVEMKNACYYTTVKNCYMASSGSSGGYGVISSDAGNYVFIKNNVMVFTGSVRGDGIELNHPTVPGYYAEITGNYISGAVGVSVAAGIGIGVAGFSNCIITNNTVLNCEGDGIHIEDGSDNCVISNNVIANVNTVSNINGSGAIVAVASNYANITNNIINSAVYGHGVYISGINGSPGTPSTGCKIQNNQINFAGKCGAYVNATNNFNVSNNIIIGANKLVNSNIYSISVAKFSGTTTSLNGIISNNTLEDAGTAVVTYALYTDSDVSANVESNILVNTINKFFINSAPQVELRSNKYSTSALSGIITLTAGTTTTVTNQNVTQPFRIKLFPLNGSAAGLASYYVSSATNYTNFVITHSAAAGTESFGYEIE